MKGNVIKYYIDRKSFCGTTACIFMLFAIIARFIGAVCDGGATGDTFELVAYVFLPMVCCLLYIFSIVFFGRKAFWVSNIPVIMGVMFFILRLSTQDNILGQAVPPVRALISLAVYLIIVSVYAGTVYGGIKTKWILVLLFILPLAYHAAVEDYPAVAAGTVEIYPLMMELSVLFILLGLIFAALGLKKRYPVNPDSGKTVAPPIPGGALLPTAENTPAEISDTAAEPAQAEAPVLPVIPTVQSAPAEEEEPAAEEEKTVIEELPAEEPLSEIQEEVPAGPEIEILPEPERDAEPEQQQTEGPDAEPERKAASLPRPSFFQRLRNRQANKNDTDISETPEEPADSGEAETAADISEDTAAEQEETTSLTDEPDES